MSRIRKRSPLTQVAACSCHSVFSELSDEVEHKSPSMVLNILNIHSNKRWDVKK